MGSVKIDTHTKERSLDVKYHALDSADGVKRLPTNMSFAFDKNSDYKTDFKNAVTKIVSQDIMDANEKNRIVNSVTDAYVTAIGERPDYREMDELSTWLIFGRKGLSTRKKMEIKALEEAEKNGRC